MNAESSSQPHTVAIINDDMAMIELIALILKNRGFDALGAVGGKNGLELVADTKPDLVILDIMMPDIDGVEVLKSLKASPDLRDIPVIMMNPNIAHWQEKLMQMGAAYFLDVPFNPNDLLKVVNRALGLDSEGNI